MRSLRPNSQGIMVPTPQEVKTGGQIFPYHIPDSSLQFIDRLIETRVPSIAITRKQGGIGDVLMTLPTVKAISRKYGIQVVYGTDYEYLSGALPAVLEGNPYISRIVPWRDINPKDFNAVIDLTCPCVAHEVPLAPPINRVDLFARHTGIRLEDTNIDYRITDEEREWAREYLRDAGLSDKTLILVQPSSSTTSRDCPTAKLVEALTGILQAKKNARALIVTHSSDSFKAEQWRYSNVHKLIDLRVRKIAAIMEQCQLIICQDSAVLHLAAALHLPTVTLFGPTDARARVNYHPEAVALWPAGKLKSYPRWYAENLDGGVCWKLIEPSLIIDTSLSILDKKPLPPSPDLVTFGYAK